MISICDIVLVMCVCFFYKRKYVSLEPSIHFLYEQRSLLT